MAIVSTRNHAQVPELQSKLETFFVAPRELMDRSWRAELARLKQTHDQNNRMKPYSVTRDSATNSRTSGKFSVDFYFPL